MRQFERLQPALVSKMNARKVCPFKLFRLSSEVAFTLCVEYPLLAYNLTFFKSMNSHCLVFPSHCSTLYCAPRSNLLSYLFKCLTPSTERQNKKTNLIRPSFILNCCVYIVLPISRRTINTRKKLIFVLISSVCYLEIFVLIELPTRAE
jgi:hypothetical protein